MGLTKQMLLIVIALSLGACGEPSEIKARVRESLIDPDSAKFGKVYLSKSGQVACVDVNSRHTLGGYTGKIPMFIFKEKDGSWGSPVDVEVVACNQGNVEMFAGM